MMFGSFFLDSVFVDIENTDVRAEGDVGSIFIQSVKNKYCKNWFILLNWRDRADVSGMSQSADVSKMQFIPQLEGKK